MDLVMHFFGLEFFTKKAHILEVVEYKDGRSGIGVVAGMSL